MTPVESDALPQRNVGQGRFPVQFFQAFTDASVVRRAKVRAVQQQLRRIDHAGAIAVGQGALAGAELRLGHAIGPAQLVPVIDMKGQG